MDSKILTGPRDRLHGTDRTLSPVAKPSVKRKEIEPMDSSEKKLEASSSKFRKIAENARQKNTPSLASPSENVSSVKKDTLRPNASDRYNSLKSISDLLPSGAPSSAEILALAERSFDAGLPYFLAKQKSNVSPIYRDASTLFDFLFNQQHTFYNVGTEEHVLWKKHVDDQEFLLFTGINAEPVSMGGIYKMLEDGLDPFILDLLLTAANPKEESFSNESKELISLLYKMNYLPSQIMPKHVDILGGLSEQERKQARICLAVSLSSVDGSPVLAKLLDQGVPVNERDVHTGFVPLTTAIVNNAKKNVDLLLKLGADLNVDKDYLAEDRVFTDDNRDLVMWARSEVNGKDT